MKRIAAITGRLAVLLGATYLLLATSAPPVCDETSPSLPFAVGPGCGPAGVVIVEADSDEGEVTLLNAGLLGYAGRARGSYTGKACPFDLGSGEWYVDGTPVAGASADAGAALDAAAGPASDAARYVNRRCEAKQTGGQLMITCQDENGVPLCSARLEARP
jgi:hypothetical protein